MADVALLDAYLIFQLKLKRKFINEFLIFFSFFYAIDSKNLYFRCGSTEEFKDCHRVRGNPRKIFPGCCDRYVCAENNTIVHKEKIK